MNFNIDKPPPTQEVLEKERELIVNEMKRLSARDTLVTFLIIATVSFVFGTIIYWYTGNIRYAGISVAIFPLLGTILSLTGVTKAAGFRSFTDTIAQLHNEYIALNPVSNDNMQDVETLSKRHKLVNDYQSRVADQGRPPVNGELAMYWEFDSSTMGKTAKGRDFLNKAKDSVSI